MLRIHLLWGFGGAVAMLIALAAANSWQGRKWRRHVKAQLASMTNAPLS